MITEIKKLAKKKGFEIYSEPYKLSIWGFRANSATPNSFDDEIHVFTNISDTKRQKWVYMVFKCTTDPGTYWLKNPMNPQGTAILNQGQYINAYQIGLHRGKYKALVQTGAKVSLTRDFNRDTILDFNNGKTVTGFFGINIHRASQVGSTIVVDKYSAGCQVFKNASDFSVFMKLCEKHRSIHGNKFTYTLVDERMEVNNQIKSTIKTIAIGTIALGIFLGGVYLAFLDHETE